MRIRKGMVLVLVVVINAICCNVVSGLRPEEIAVVANRNAAKSIGLAKYYMKKRGIPDDHLIELWITDKEACSREEYEKKVVPKLLQYLKKDSDGSKIRCVVTVYGVPLKIAPPALTKKEKAKIKELARKLKELQVQYDSVPGTEKEKRKNLRRQIKQIRGKIKFISKGDWRSAFDSELALVKATPYPLKGWIPNPYFLGFQRKKLQIGKEQVLMVSRLDGPNEKIVKRIIDDSFEVERIGLKGKGYFDARWPRPKKEKAENMKVGYSFYDYSIHKAADLVKNSGHMEVVVDDTSALFQAGQCTRAALYCGWYRLAHYVDAFEWEKGAVGYHIASSECSTLRRANSQVWCKRMLEDGVDATLGPTSEPYVQAFPVPELFFGLLVTGDYSLAECYILSLPFLSWQMVLVGDPLYNPFKAYTHPQD